MISIVKTRDRVCQHLRALNFPDKEASRIASQLYKWLVCNGPEWTVERFKNLKQAHLESLQTEELYKPPTGWATRVNSKGQRILKDGLLHRILTHTGFNLKQVEGFLRLFQVVILDQVTKKQLHKMETAITAQSNYDPQRLMELSFDLKPRTAGNLLAKYMKIVGAKSKVLPDFLGSPERRSPSFAISYKGVITYARSVRRSLAESADWLEYFQTNSEWNQFWKKYPEQVAHVFGTSRLSVSTMSDTTDENLLGSVTILQSHGAKARWIANPLLALQAIGEPLKNKLLAYSKLYPEIKTTDQDAGHSVVVDWLKSGLKVYSFDATSFTDRFPVALQLNMARKLHDLGVIDSFDLDALVIVSKGKWWSTDMQKEIKWEVGQPLGYGPSFHLATLAHAMILDHLDQTTHGSRTGCWQVVGDDVVINDTHVATKYKETMEQLGVEINLSKSLISSKYAEFLGKILTLDGVNPSIKLKIFSNHSQIIDALAFYGWNGWKHLSTKEKFEALDVFLPEHLGGLGWKLPGVPLEKFYSMMNQNRLSERVLRKDLRDFFGKPENSSSLSYILELRSEYYFRNSLGLSLSEWEKVSQESLRLNDLNELPSSISDVTGETDTQRCSTNTFASTVDNMVRLENLTSKRLVTEEGEIDRSNPATSILNNLGYINNSEKPPSGQSDHLKENNYEERTSKPTRGIFSKDFRNEISSRVKEIRQKLEEEKQSTTVKVKGPK